MATLTGLLPQVLPECPGVPRPVALNAVRNAAREFCERSLYWQADHAPITTVTDESGTGEYTLTMPTGAQLVSVLDPIHHNNYPVYQKTERWLEENQVTWRTKVGDQANWWHYAGVNIVRLVPYPTTAQTNSLLISMALKPDTTSDELDDRTNNDWYEHIASGAKARLMLMPNKQWSDEKLAEINLAIFNQGISDAFSKAISGFQNQKADRNNRGKAHFF